MRAYEYNSNAQPQEHTYINGYTNQVEHTQRSQTSLKDIFKQLDEREAQIDDKLAKEQQAEQEAEQAKQIAAQTAQTATEQQIAPSQPTYAQPTLDQYYPAELEGKNQNYSTDAEKGNFVTSAVVSRQEGGFDYEKDDVNYRDFSYPCKIKAKHNRNRKTATNRLFGQRYKDEIVFKGLQNSPLRQRKYL